MYQKTQLFVILFFFINPCLIAHDKVDKTDSLYQIFWDGDKEKIQKLLGELNSEAVTSYYFKKEKLLKGMLELSEQNDKYSNYTIEIKNTLGRFYLLRDKKELGFKYIAETEAYYKENKKYVDLFLSYYYLASLFYHSNDEANTTKYVQLAQQYEPYLDSIANSNDIINLYNIIGLQKKQAKKYTEALEALELALAKAKAHKNEAWIGLLNGNIGSISFELGNYEDALPYLEKDIEISINNGLYGSAANAESLKMKIYVLQEKWELAEKSLQKTLDLTEKMNASDNKVGLYEAYSFYYEKTKDYENALKYKQLHFDSEKEITEQNKNIEINRLKYKFDNEQQEQTIISQDLQIINQRYFNYISLGITVSLLALLVFGFAFYNRQKKMSKIIKDSNRRLREQFQLQKKQQQEIEAQNKKMEAVLAVKDKIFSIISHDLRSPIGNLTTIFELFDQNDISTEDFKELMLEMKPQISVLYETMNNLLLWANTQLKNGENVQLKQVAVFPIVEEIKDLYKDACQKKQIEIKNNIDRHVAVLADENQLKIVLRNLIFNAIKFSYTGGCIGVSAKKEKDGIGLLVEDKGVGMSTEDLQKLFKIHFTQRGTQNEKGTGLGLQLSKDFVEANGGSLTVSSEKGKGTVFCVMLKDSVGSTQ